RRGASRQSLQDRALRAGDPGWRHCLGDAAPHLALGGSAARHVLPQLLHCPTRIEIRKSLPFRRGWGRDFRRLSLALLSRISVTQSRLLYAIILRLLATPRSPLGPT